MNTLRFGARAPTHGRPGLSRANVVVLIAIVVIGDGLLLPAIQNHRDRGGARSTATYYLKSIALGAANYHDQFLRFPGNGSGVGEGMASPTKPDDGSFFFQILPFIEQDALYRTPVTHKGNEPLYVRYYLEPARGRGRMTGPGPVSDYAVNLLALYGDDSPPTPLNTKETLGYEKIADGTSNTILIGSKSLHPSDYHTTDPSVDDTFLKLSAGGTSTVGARYTLGATTGLKDLTAQPPAEYLAPLAVRDQLAAKGIRSDHFGGPYPTGVLFAFCDGHVSLPSYEWLAQAKTVPIKPVAWGTPPTDGTFDRVSQYRAVLTPRGGEEFMFE